MKFAIVGSSNITEVQKMYAEKVIKAALLRLLVEHDEVIVVSGHSPKGGIDIIAEQVATELKMDMKLFVPGVFRWEDDGDKLGYKSRNKLIASACDAMLCIRSEQSTTYGSGWTADYAERLGKTVYRLTV